MKLMTHVLLPGLTLPLIAAISPAPSQPGPGCWFRALGTCSTRLILGGYGWYKEKKSPTTAEGCRKRMTKAAWGCGSLVEMSFIDSHGVAHTARSEPRPPPDSYVSACQFCHTCLEGTWHPLTSSTTDVVHWPRFDGHGRVADPASPVSAEIVLSHCTLALDWLDAAIEKLADCGVRVGRVSVYSKCGRPVLGAPAGARVMVLPNVGRCDHTYAHHLHTQWDSLAPMIFFMKDSSFAGGVAHAHKMRVPMCSLAGAAHARSFGCGFRPAAAPGELSPLARARVKDRACPVQEPWSSWHNLSVLGTFQMRQYVTEHAQTDSAAQGGLFNAPVRPLGAWIASVVEGAGLADATAVLSRLRQPLVPVCYGGTFATTSAQVRRHERKLWAALAARLSRADNIEEGHYMERLWAPLLARVPSPRRAQRIAAAATYTVTVFTANVSDASTAAPPTAGGISPHRGMLFGCSCKRAAGVAAPASVHAPAPSAGEVQRLRPPAGWHRLAPSQQRGRPAAEAGILVALQA